MYVCMYMFKFGLFILYHKAGVYVNECTVCMYVLFKSGYNMYG